MLRKIISIILFTLSIFNASFCFSSPNTSSKTIGIIIPMEHKALNDIVEGFKESMKQHYPYTVEYNIQNAQGDIKLQRSIIEQFIGQKVDLIVPIGTTTTQMALSLVKEQPIVSLAADYSEQDRQARSIKNMTGVLDAVEPKKKLDFIQEILPDLKNITLIYHSANVRNDKEIEALKMLGQKKGIVFQTLGIQTLPELQTASRNMNPNTQAVLILKDHLIASGVKLLIPASEKKSIPLITSDEGSVYEGGAFALGVSEKNIGNAGALLAAEIFKGTSIETLTMKPIESLTIFYNPTACRQIHLDVKKLQMSAERNHYQLVPTDFRTSEVKK